MIPIDIEASISKVEPSFIFWETSFVKISELSSTLFLLHSPFQSASVLTRDNTLEQPGPSRGTNVITSGHKSSVTVNIGQHARPASLDYINFIKVRQRKFKELYQYTVSILTTVLHQNRPKCIGQGRAIMLFAKHCYEQRSQMRTINTLEDMFKVICKGCTSEL